MRHGPSMSSPADFDSRKVFEAIAADPRIFPAVAELAGRLSCQPEDLDAPLLHLSESGYVEVWGDADGRRCVTLTPWAAELCGLVPDEQGKRWLRKGVRLRRSRPPGRRAIPSFSELTGGHSDQEVRADEFIDERAVDPHEAAERQEEAVKLAEKKEAKGDYAPALPRPRILLGATGDWSGGLKPPPLCPGCSDEVLIIHEPEPGGPIEIFETLVERKLGLVEYCLRCNRSGFDWMLPKTIAEPLSPSKPPTGKHAGRRPVKDRPATRRRRTKPKAPVR